MFHDRFEMAIIERFLICIYCFFSKLFIKEVECKLCQITLPNRMNARLHLKSALHKARAMKYLETDDRSCDSRSEVTDDYENY